MEQVLGLGLVEIRDLLLSWLVLGLAFANLLGGFSEEIIIVSLATVGVGFLLHELSHQAVARYFGLGATFVANYLMLLFALLMSLAGFIFAAPGAVVTSGRRDDRTQMYITAAGPVTNIFLALIFHFIPGQIGFYGAEINAWLALFNMIPYGGLDGQDVLRYSGLLYFFIAGLALVLVILF